MSVLPLDAPPIAYVPPRERLRAARPGRGPLPTDPTPAEIAEACEAIQATWSASERRSRRVQKIQRVSFDAVEVAVDE